jgi:hypothetical protein
MPGTIEDLAALALAFYNKNHGGRLKLYDFIARLENRNRGRSRARARRVVGGYRMYPRPERNPMKSTKNMAKVLNERFTPDCLYRL